jgi:hypothetical protein
MHPADLGLNRPECGCYYEFFSNLLVGSTGSPRTEKKAAGAGLLDVSTYLLKIRSSERL